MLRRIQGAAQAAGRHRLHSAQQVVVLEPVQGAQRVRARANALRALEGLEDDHLLRGVEAVTAGGLRRALDPAQLRERWGDS